MGDQSFWMLCEVGDIEGVQAAIANGADVNEEGLSGQTGLMRALLRSHNNVVQVLLQLPQIDVNKVDEDGWTALHSAVMGHNHEGLAALLARGDELTPSINQRINEEGYSPIMYAVWRHSVNCFHQLLTNPFVDLDTRDNYERSPQEVCR